MNEASTLLRETPIESALQLACASSIGALSDQETLEITTEFSDPAFTRALGHQGESLADAGFARIGFWIRQTNVNEVDGK
jgi:hypothetical protein